MQNRDVDVRKKSLTSNTHRTLGSVFVPIFTTLIPLFPGYRASLDIAPEAALEAPVLLDQQVNGPRKTLENARYGCLCQVVLPNLFVLNGWWPCVRISASIPIYRAIRTHNVSNLELQHNGIVCAYWLYKIVVD